MTFTILFSYYIGCIVFSFLTFNDLEKTHNVNSFSKFFITFFSFSNFITMFINLFYIPNFIQ